jgi:hypothetical protein
LIFTFEVALPLGAIGFYLYDSIVLLYGNELVFVRSGRRWRVTAGLQLFFGSRRLSLPGLCQPWTLLFRAAWKEADTRTAVPADWPPQSLVDALGPLKWICATLLLMLLAPLPLISVTWGAGVALLIVFACFYVLILLALTLVYLRRERLDLTRAAFWKVAVDALACPPFAINLVHKLTLNKAMPGNPLMFADARLDAARYDQLVAVVRSRIEDFLLAEDPDSEAARSLVALRDGLKERYERSAE